MPAPFRLRPALIAGAALLVLAGGVAAFHRKAPGPARPNIVLIVWDTCRGDLVSVNGYAHPTTPRLAELAAEGVTFRRCFTPAPWTPPAHASLFTGLLPADHGIHQGFGGERVAAGIPLLAESLSNAGYETVCISANGLVSDVNGLTRGFQKKVPVNLREGASGSGWQVRNLVAEEVAGRRAAKETRPLFLFVNLMECHQPYVFEAAAVAAVRGDGAVNGARRAAAEVDVKRTRAHLFEGNPVDEATLLDLSAAYDGAVRVDDGVTGEILGLLRTAGLMEGAFVAVCGDHGENLGEHGELAHLMSVYEPVLHVPLVVRWPGRARAGRVEDAEVRLQDLYPTILEAAEVPVPPAVREGRPLPRRVPPPPPDPRRRVRPLDPGPARGARRPA